MRQGFVPSEAFAARLSAAEVLLTFPSPSQECDWNELASELDSLSLSFDNPASATSYSAFAGLMRILSSLAQWYYTVLNARPDAERFLKSAKSRHKLWLQEYEKNLTISRLLEAAKPIEVLAEISDVVRLLNAIGSVPLPIGLLARAAPFHPMQMKATAHEMQVPPPDLTVAFLKFQVDSIEAKNVHRLTPGEVHDLEIEVRVSRWPNTQSELELTPVSVEPASSYEFPTFRFVRPEGEPPYSLSQRGRAFLKASQGLNARPFEFKYMAEFLPAKSEQPVAIVGHRTLLIDGTSTATPISGYVEMDRQLIYVRESLRQLPGISQLELQNILTLLTTIFNLAGSAVQDALFPGIRSESQFQEDVRRVLRSNPAIGAELDEHANAAGGITDLSFHGIPIELKVENSRLFELSTGIRYVAQAASYAVAKGRKCAVLCILDCSEKAGAPRNPSELVQLVIAENGVRVCIIVIQGNLRKPSALSR